MQQSNFKSLPANLITGFALGEFVKLGPRKKLKRRGATLITGATLNTGFMVYVHYTYGLIAEYKLICLILCCFNFHDLDHFHDHNFHDQYTCQNLY